LPKSITDIIAENASPLVLAFLVHFAKHGLAGDRRLINKLRDRVEGDPFAGSYWPLTLELTHFHDEDPIWATATTVAALRVLHENRISIIEWNAPPRVFELDVAPGPEPRFPPFAIEDVGSDYPGDEEDDDDDEDEGHGFEDEFGF
jgi:hypothetical protein